MSTPLAQALLRYIDRQDGESPYATPMDSMLVLRADHARPPAPRLFAPALCIVAQGSKWASFGVNRFEYKAGEALVVAVEAPSIGRVTQASPEEPCLVLVVGLDLMVIRDVAEALGPSLKPSQGVTSGVFVTDFQGPLNDCALRLVALLDTPQAIPTLYPLIMREICYWLLAGPHGGDIAHIAQVSHPSQHVMDAMAALKNRFNHPFRLEELADIARLSPSAFHRQFKALTSMTPLQYQKQLRLLEARRLMVTQGANVETAAFEVGYSSASQFSREYLRFFNVSPKQHSRYAEAQPVPG